MSDNLLSFKKRFLIAIIFSAFFLLLLFITLFAKKQKTTLPDQTTPTLVPIGTKNNTHSAISSKIESSSVAKDSNLGDVIFRYEQKSLPTTETIYAQAPTSIPVDTISKIQEKLMTGGTERIINTPNGQVMFMQKDSKTLTIYIYSRTLVFSDSAAPKNTTSNYAEIALSMVSSLSLPVDSSSPTITYFSNKTDDLSKVQDLSQADIIDVSFKEKVNNLTVFRQFGSDAIAHILITKDGKINKLTYVFAPQYQPQRSIVLPNLSSAEEMIKNNKGIIVSVGDDYKERTTKTINSTVFTSVDVGYFSDFEGGTLLPIFVFKGTATIESQQKPITVYLPIDN